jgi:hypothetical protein
MINMTIASGYELLIKKDKKFWAEGKDNAYNMLKIGVKCFK